METLVAFEYGSGRIWGIVVGATPDQIAAAIPEVDVFEEPPPWMTEEDIASLHRHPRFELNGSGIKVLDQLIANKTVLIAA
jgi:hypothetical protein